MSETFVIPERLRNHAEVIGALDPDSQSVRYYNATWERYFPNDPDLAAIEARYAGLITRSGLFDLGREALADELSLRQVFLATMLWGYGTNGRGPVRTQRMLADANHLNGLGPVIAALKTGALHDAYSSFYIPYCGPAFLTKFLYVMGIALNAPQTPLILDSRVARALKRLAEDGDCVLRDYVRLDASGMVMRYPEGYSRFVADMRLWATALEVRPDALEMFLFNPPAAFFMPTEENAQNKED